MNHRKLQIQNYKLQINLKSQVLKLGFWCLVSGIYLLLGNSTALAVVNPLGVPNNKFGIHIISGTADEVSPAAELVNSSGGDWGYVTVLIESKDRDHHKWQKFFDDLRRRHLIPLVRLATEPDGGKWKLPYEGEEIAWADFLDNLIWPVKNRYVIIYNEPNQAQEWAGQVDPKSYAQVLDKTITALKNKNPDFFLLNSGFDASAPHQPPSFWDEWTFLKQMDQAVPGILNKLDGWVSHSYPNPGFAGSPLASGKGSVKTWFWELQKLKELGVNKILPVFITETGWKHAEGIDLDKSLPNAETVGKYLEEAFQNAWESNRIVAVTPFLLNYQEPPFDHFSFKKITGKPQNKKILGAFFPEFYPHYEVMRKMSKTTGRPVQENKAELIKGQIYPSLVVGESYLIPLTFKNRGQSIWNEYEVVELRILEDQTEVGMEAVKLPLNQKIEPGQEAIFNIYLQAKKPGVIQSSLQLFMGNKPFDQNPLEFTTEIKSPVKLQVFTTLSWKDNFAGQYLLSTLSDLLNSTTLVDLNPEGKSNLLEAKYLLPDHNFTFTLERPFYKPRTINLQVKSGLNELNFGRLEPDFVSVLLQPKQFWQLLPFSN